MQPTKKRTIRIFGNSNTTTVRNNDEIYFQLSTNSVLNYTKSCFYEIFSSESKFLVFPHCTQVFRLQIRPFLPFATKAQARPARVWNRRLTTSLGLAGLTSLESGTSGAGLTDISPNTAASNNQIDAITVSNTIANTNTSVKTPITEPRQ